MAMNQDQRLFQCTGCHEELDFKSKTLPCLHSFCCPCLDRNLDSKTNNNGQCPECYEPLIVDQLSLSPFLGKSLRRRQLELGDLKCDLCLEDGVESMAKNWCHDCQTLFCVNCSRYHKKLQRKHNSTDFDGMTKEELAEMMTTAMCFLHQKVKDCYCKQCNMCFCDSCYQNHSTECSSQPLFVWEEASKQKTQGSTLAENMDVIEIGLQRMKEKTKEFTKELNADCNSKCQQLWLIFEEMVENAKKKTEKLCNEMRQITNDQIKRWRQVLEENEKILKQLEIWRLNLHHLLRESRHDVDVVCGLRSIESKLLSHLDKSVEPEEMCQLKITFPNRWQQVLERIKDVNIGSVSWEGGTLPAKNLDALPAAKTLDIYDEWNMKRGLMDISSIVVTKEDNYVYVSDRKDKSIIGFTETGDFLCECLLFEQSKQYTPVDMCSISSDILAVCCFEEHIFLLERRKIAPFLRIKEVISKPKFVNSLCQLYDKVITGNHELKIYSMTENGQNKRLIRRGSASDEGDFRIRANSLTGNLWATKYDRRMCCFNSYGEKILSEEIQEEILDFCIDEFGQIYFCNESGIFTFNPLKELYTFRRKYYSLRVPRIFALKNKIFVSLCDDGEGSIQIFELFD